MVRNRPVLAKFLGQRPLNSEQTDEYSARHRRLVPGKRRSECALRTAHCRERNREHEERDQGERRETKPAAQAAERLGQQVHHRARELQIE